MRPLFTVSIGVCVLICSCGAASAPTTPAPTQNGYVLSWSDEFNGADQSAPDPAKWSFETGGNGWGNNELESYTTRLTNAHLEGGKLAITAIRENYTGADGIARSYTSARLKTAGLFTQAYGRFEASIKLPQGQGIWPAFWMLGNNIDIGSAGWPLCGEIDIMENLGQDMTTVYGTLHGPGYSGANGIQSKYTLPTGQQFSNGYHLFAVEWEPNQIRFYVDNTLYGTHTPANLPKGARWVYNHPFFIILNVAVGGYWPGPPNASTQFPQKMLVDYVRVYHRKGE